MGKKGCQLRVRKREQVLEVWGIRGKQRLEKSLVFFCPLCRSWHGRKVHKTQGMELNWLYVHSPLCALALGSDGLESWPHPSTDGWPQGRP